MLRYTRWNTGQTTVEMEITPCWRAWLCNIPACEEITAKARLLFATGYRRYLASGHDDDENCVCLAGTHRYGVLAFGWGAAVFRYPGYPTHDNGEYACIY